MPTAAVTRADAASFAATNAVFGVRALAEFQSWCESLSTNRCPRPDGTGGLPPGWVPVAHPFSEVVNQHSHGYLARLDAGWVLVAHDPRDRVTFVLDSNVSLLDLTNGDALTSQLVPRPFSEWLIRVVGSFYDPADLDEAAEQMLCVLRRRVRVLPRALI